jgi:hypothetical protein
LFIHDQETSTESIPKLTLITLSLDGYTNPSNKIIWNGIGAFQTGVFVLYKILSDIARPFFSEEWRKYHWSVTVGIRKLYYDFESHVFYADRVEDFHAGLCRSPYGEWWAVTDEELKQLEAKGGSVLA